MFGKLIDLALENRFVVILSSLLLVAVGCWAMTKLPVDAVPDVTNVQVQVMTTAPALGPEETEQFITFPVETAASQPRVAPVSTAPVAPDHAHSPAGASGIPVASAAGRLTSVPKRR